MTNETLSAFKEIVPRLSPETCADIWQVLHKKSEGLWAGTSGEDILTPNERRLYDALTVRLISESLAVSIVDNATTDST